MPKKWTGLFKVLEVTNLPLDRKLVCLSCGGAFTIETAAFDESNDNNTVYCPYCGLRGTFKD